MNSKLLRFFSKRLKRWITVGRKKPKIPSFSPISRFAKSIAKNPKLRKKLAAQKWRERKIFGSFSQLMGKEASEKEMMYSPIVKKRVLGTESFFGFNPKYFTPERGEEYHIKGKDWLVHNHPKISYKTFVKAQSEDIFASKNIKYNPLLSLAYRLQSKGYISPNDLAFAHFNKVKRMDVVYPSKNIAYVYISKRRKWPFDSVRKQKNMLKFTFKPSSYHKFLKKHGIEIYEIPMKDYKV